MRWWGSLIIKGLLSLVTVLGLLLAGPAYMLAGHQLERDVAWFQADRTSTGQAPAPDEVRDAVVQVYAARAFDWRGAFGVHTWIATKAENAEQYRTHQVLGWHRPTVISRFEAPDRTWFGNPPTLLAELRGDAAARAIPAIEAAVARYPAPDVYRIWPGPNSNTFTAWIVRQVPELKVDFPPLALGKDYLLEGLVARAPSETGYQLALWGVLGAMAAWDEGVELNLLGLTVGVDVTSPALKLPGVGRLGMPQPTGSDRQRQVDQNAELERMIDPEPVTP
ncbi:DUF3750 domain-containing protein [Halomonas sp. WWR20]